MKRERGSRRTAEERAGRVNVKVLGFCDRWLTEEKGLGFFQINIQVSFKVAGSVEETGLGLIPCKRAGVSI